MTRNSSTDSYILGRSAAETERLIRQAQIYGPLTRQFLVGAGITSGMHILDIGSGAGDVALLLADLVGPRGSVTGVDVNGAILETARQRVRAAGWTNVSFVEGDAHTTTLDHPYDVIVGRWVLMYLPERVALLRRLRSYLRPGGIVAFQEIDFSYPPAAFPAGPLHQQLQHWMAPPPGRGGPDGHMGLTLFQAYLNAGLPAPQLRLDAPIGGGEDWPGYAYVADTFSSLLPRLEQMGIVTAEQAGIATLAERLRHEVVSRRGVQMLPLIIGAWARHQP